VYGFVSYVSGSDKMADNCMSDVEPSSSYTRKSFTLFVICLFRYLFSYLVTYLVS
jgi:hypothetical protein